MTALHEESSQAPEPRVIDRLASCLVLEGIVPLGALGLLCPEQLRDHEVFVDVDGEEDVEEAKDEGESCLEPTNISDPVEHCVHISVDIDPVLAELVVDRDLNFVILLIWSCLFVGDPVDILLELCDWRPQVNTEIILELNVSLRNLVATLCSHDTIA